ncbi:hypothetical protein B296_00013072 [Ensete ventricosum]|uniref:Uncharacterized protein n=1 Tax=Ensete ventricosum TaxID=4639 RepID=A0A426YGD0_ENSVE|nr:hypothetical protein B296_00013072 [Ensete ventricosum]
MQPLFRTLLKSLKSKDKNYEKIVRTKKCGEDSETVYLQVHHRHVALQGNFVFAKIVHQLFLLRNSISAVFLEVLQLSLLAFTKAELPLRLFGRIVDLTQVRSAPPTCKRTPHRKDNKHGGGHDGMVEGTAA